MDSDADEIKARIAELHALLLFVLRLLAESEARAQTQIELMNRARIAAGGDRAAVIAEGNEALERHLLPAEQYVRDEVAAIHHPPDDKSYWDRPPAFGGD